MEQKAILIEEKDDICQKEEDKEVFENDDKKVNKELSTVRLLQSSSSDLLLNVFPY
jgi:hypothetical protein